MNKQNSPKGIVFLITAAVVWGFAFVAQNIGADSVPAFFFNGARFLLGAVSLIPVILLFERGADDPAMKKRTLTTGLVAGVLLCTASYLQQVGIELTDTSGKAGFITGLYMILVPIFGLFLRRKTGLKTWIGAVFGVTGLFLVCMSGGKLTFTRGDIFLIACAVVYTLHIMWIDHFGAGVYSLRFSMTQFAMAAVLNFIGCALFESVTFAGFQAAFLPILYCGIMSTGVAYTCQVLGQKYSEPTSASIILSTESVFSAIGGAIILHERMSGAAYLGCVLIFAGILLSQIKFNKNKHNSI
ncbi:MAG: DMT family transporter [Clostridia bacterium]|nr:DMT family transporter [Clostridia bacterium]